MTAISERQLLGPVISYVTTMAAAKATIAGIKEIKFNKAAKVHSLQELHSQIQDKE